MLGLSFQNVAPLALIDSQLQKVVALLLLVLHDDVLPLPILTFALFFFLPSKDDWAQSTKQSFPQGLHPLLVLSLFEASPPV